MPKVPALKSSEVIKILQKYGFKIARSSGSHIRLIHPDGRKVTVAWHNRPIAKGTLHAIMRQSKLTPQDFLSPKNIAKTVNS